MILKVLASGSKANSYILETETEALILEAGVPFRKLIRHVDHKKIVGCLVSHKHLDHAKYVEEYRKYGIGVYGPGNLKESGIYRLGRFDVRPFDCMHDVPCFGYKIHHQDSGGIIFATDTATIKYKFHNIHHWLIECNYSEEILDKKVENGMFPVLADRIVKDHMSLATCREILSKHDLSYVRNIVLLHLSDGNSNAEQFQREVQELTKVDTHIAEEGLEISLSLCPF